MRTPRQAIRETRKAEDDRGAVLFIMLLFLVIFIAVAAVAVDLASLSARGQELQNTSDAAALAGVVEYQDQILAGAGPAAAEAAALTVVRDVMAQNGIDPALGNIEIDVWVSADGSQLTVSILDTDPDEFLPNDLLGESLKPGDATVQRQATAEFLACLNECSIIVEIPEPFPSIGARGNGDGYKPIAVGNRLYALNHNSGDRNIVCVDRVTRERCWAESVYRPAYFGGVDFADRNPEMPQTAVVNDTIYWTVTDEDHGLRLFCWLGTAEFDVPCTSAFELDPGLIRYDEGEPDNLLVDDKDENRGGGTFTVLGNKVFVFSDNHRIHCFDPSTGGVCFGYDIGGNPTALDVFPPNSPVDGNHGSSIDRIVDEKSGYVYSTLHIPYAQESVSCSSSLPDPAGREVVVINETTGRFLASDSPDSVFAADSGAEVQARWNVENVGGDTLSFQSVAHGEYLDGSPFVGTSSSVGQDDEWYSRIDGDAYFIDSKFFDNALVDDDGTIVADPVDPPLDPDGRWNYFPWQCGVDPTLTATTPAYFKSGTWLHCYNTGTKQGVPGLCPGFTVSGVGADAPGTPSPIHLDGTRFSGRLWFYYSAAPGEAEPEKLGVCSSGYSQWYAPGSSLAPSTIEVNCVRLSDGAFDLSMTSAMDGVRNEIAGSTGVSPGAWGDPHWNATENRLLYPTEHNTPLIICYDFDSGLCPGISQTVVDEDGVTWDTEDYGFVSDGNCVFALGHTAFFWAFKASDLGAKCDTQPLPVTVERCPCGDGETFKWGELDFRGVELDRFDVFGVRVLTDAGDASVPIYPASGAFHSIKPGGASQQIPLDDLQIPDGATTITVEIHVEGAGGSEIADLGDFEVRFAQRPRLVS